MVSIKSKTAIILAIFLSAAVIAGMPASVNAGEDIMELSRLEPGMEGRGRTVFSGMEVEEFDFEVIDILRDYEPGQDFILVYLSGERIEEAGGVAAGMSGSPLFIEDRMVGAISYGWQDSDNRYALATPIEPMLSVLESGDFDREDSVDELPELAMPLMVGGISGRRQEMMKESLQDYFHKDFEVVPGAEEPRLEPEEYPELEPGSSISVQLARGDVNVASIGTLTYKSGSDILAMGHPFTHQGEVSFLLGQAHISSIIPGDMPFKLGSPLPQPIGTVFQDRSAGLGGGLDQFPGVVPLNVKVEDEDRGEVTSMDVQIVNDEELLTTLPATISLQALDSGLDRIGPGTAETKISVMANELEEVYLSRENMYYSQSDIAARSLSDLQQLMQIINQNPFKDAGLFDIEFEVNVTEEDNVALIQEAEINEDDQEINPGDELDISVMLRPYRQEKMEMQYSLELPEDINPGPASLSITGGPEQRYQVETAEELEDSLSDSVEGYTELEPMLADFLELPRNNDLVLEVYPGYPGIRHWEEEEPDEAEEVEDPETEERPEPEEPEEDVEEEPEEMPPEEAEERIREVEETDYVLEGSLYIDFTVTESDHQAEEEDDQNGVDR